MSLNIPKKKQIDANWDGALNDEGFPRMLFTRDDLEELKKLYAASSDGQVFKFKGLDIVHEYAKYMIEYLEYQFK